MEHVFLLNKGSNIIIFLVSLNQEIDSKGFIHQGNVMFRTTFNVNQCNGKHYIDFYFAPAHISNTMFFVQDGSISDSVTIVRDTHKYRPLYM